MIGPIALELYVDPKNEAEGPKRRTRGFYLPHEDYKTGAKKVSHIRI